MTVNEAIERIKTMAFMCDDFHNCKYGHDCTDGCSEAVKMAVDALQGSIKKHIGKDNMVISSSDLMTILNSDSEELKKYKEVGTVEEFKALKVKNEPMQLDEHNFQDEPHHYLCPVCRNIVSHNQNYCEECGQALEI